MQNTRGVQGVVWLIAGVAALSAAVTAYIRVDLSKQSTQTAGNGRFTKAQILSQSQPLLQALIMGTTNIQTFANPTTTFDRTGQSVHHWSVDCADPTSGDRAHLLWNADTGELIQANQFRQHEKYTRFGLSPTEKAPTGFAWDWFRALKIGRATDQWHIVAALQKHYAQWDIWFRSGDRYSILTVKADSGELVQVLCGHLPRANMVWAPLKAGSAS
jgi:hypothetical protein